MTARLAVSVRGVTQGVGFRPFVYRAARARALVGWVRNDGAGVEIEVQGDERALADFVAELRERPPPHSVVERVDVRPAAPSGDEGFRIVESAPPAAVRPTVPADLATCPACLAEVATPGARRHGYPFTNCTRCGPRYTIVRALPYDRPHTSMAGFPLCAACAREYHDPEDRRFHAQPVACPACGPRLRLVSRDGTALADGDAALAAAARAVTRGAVLALQGLGGFQLLVDAADPDALATLRARKRRGEKPFAVMFPSLDAARAWCDLTDAEARALASPEAPIVLVRGRPPSARVQGPGARVGAMLPYTPLHHLLLGAAARPLVCTSGNLAEEPMCTEADDALARLGRVADVFLVHDRPIVRPVDDSVCRVGADGVEVLRRARGFAPRPHRVAPASPPILALGGHLKATVALVVDGEAVVSQHLGDLESPAGVALLERTARDLAGFLRVTPAVVACDLHPDYASTRLAERLAREWSARFVAVQHHHAHALAVAAEHGLAGPFLGLAWDGTGHGADGVAWGGEALACEGARFRRVAWLRPFPLPGGDRAAREPRRAALGLLWERYGAFARCPPGWFTETETRVLTAALTRGFAAPLTTSAGRLFDAVAALAGLRPRCSYEAQAAAELEHLSEDVPDAYPLPLGGDGVGDWGPLVDAVLADRAAGVRAGVIGGRFHEALAAFAEACAVRAGLGAVALGGGCFQNARLAARVRARLEARGFTVYAPRRFPANDGGLALGQALAALRAWEEDDSVPGRAR